MPIKTGILLYRKQIGQVKFAIGPFGIVKHQFPLINRMANPNISGSDTDDC
jgi:hypothetical protein